MTIDSVSIEQYAGISDVKKSFAPGMNVLLGDNEAGKSTFISALFYALTKNVKLDRRSDSGFMETAFPSDGSETVDAGIEFSADGREYMLEKVWDKSGTESAVKLREKDGPLERGGKAEQKLKELLVYGTSVYDHLIFGRQGNEKEVLEWCDDFFAAGTKNDLDETRKIIAQAFSAVQGISPDKFAEKLEERIKEYGKRWNDAAEKPDVPPRGKTRYENGCGKLVEAYYAYEDAVREQKSAVDAENEIKEKEEKLAVLTREKKELDDQKDKLVQQQNAVELKASAQRELASASKNLSDAQNAAKDWPEKLNLLEKCRSLDKAKTERDNRKKKEEIEKRLEKINGLNKELEELNSIIGRYPDIKKDAETAIIIDREIFKIQTGLSAISLKTTVTLSDGYTAVLSGADGLEKTVSGMQTQTSDGFVNLQIPGVAQITVAPAELDIERLTGELKTKKDELNKICKKYSVGSLEALKNLADEIERKEKDAADKEYQKESCLNGKTEAELLSEAGQIKTDLSVTVPEKPEDIVSELLTENGKNSLDILIGAIENTTEDYQEKYKSGEHLAEVISGYEEEVKKAEARLAEYESKDTLSEADFNMQKASVDKKLEANAEALGNIHTEIGTLSAVSYAAPDELAREIEDKLYRLNELKTRYKYYLRIQKDFEELRGKQGDGFEQFYERFNEYLQTLSDGHIVFAPGDKGLKLTSGKNSIKTVNLLSKGSKKTVLLAFRLAVLSYFFPAGGGLIVLDDEILDMDPTRRSISAKMLNEFAGKNQVIFSTCDPAIAGLLGGNIIPMG